MRDDCFYIFVSFLFLVILEFLACLIILHGIITAQCALFFNFGYFSEEKKQLERNPLKSGEKNLRLINIYLIFIFSLILITMKVVTFSYLILIDLYGRVSSLSIYQISSCWRKQCAICCHQTLLVTTWIVISSLIWSFGNKILKQQINVSRNPYVWNQDTPYCVLISDVVYSEWNTLYSHLFGSVVMIYFCPRTEKCSEHTMIVPLWLEEHAGVTSWR